MPIGAPSTLGPTPDLVPLEGPPDVETRLTPTTDDYSSTPSFFHSGHYYLSVCKYINIYLYSI